MSHDLKRRWIKGTEVVPALPCIPELGLNTRRMSLKHTTILILLLVYFCVLCASSEKCRMIMLDMVKRIDDNRSVNVKHPRYRHDKFRNLR